MRKNNLMIVAATFFTAQVALSLLFACLGYAAGRSDEEAKSLAGTRFMESGGATKLNEESSVVNAQDWRAGKADLGLASASKRRLAVTSPPSADTLASAKPVPQKSRGQRILRGVLIGAAAGAVIGAVGLGLLGAAIGAGMPMGASVAFPFTGALYGGLVGTAAGGVTGGIVGAGTN